MYSHQVLSSISIVFLQIVLAASDGSSDKSDESAGKLRISGTVTTVSKDGIAKKASEPIPGALVIAVPEGKIPARFLPTAPRIITCNSKEFVPSIVCIMPDQFVEVSIPGEDEGVYRLTFDPFTKQLSDAILSPESRSCSFQTHPKGRPFTRIIDAAVPHKNCRIVTVESPFYVYADAGGNYQFEFPVELMGNFRVIAYGPKRGKTEVATRFSKSTAIKRLDLQIAP